MGILQFFNLCLSFILIYLLFFIFENHHLADALIANKYDLGSFSCNDLSVVPSHELFSATFQCLENQHFSFALKHDYIDKVLRFVDPILKNTPSFVELEDESTITQDLVVFGDIHGNLSSLLSVLSPFIVQSTSNSSNITTDSMGSSPKKNSPPRHISLSPNYQYVFLGDIVDRGAYSLESVLLILTAIISHNELYYQSNSPSLNASQHPSITLLRGNHEFLQTFANFGFLQELQKKLFLDSRGGMRKSISLSQSAHMIFLSLLDTFSLLPLAASKGEIFLSHGGLPLQHNPTLLTDSFSSSILSPSQQQKITNNNTFNGQTILPVNSMRIIDGFKSLGKLSFDPTSSDFSYGPWESVLWSDYRDITDGFYPMDRTLSKSITNPRGAGFLIGKTDFVKFMSFMHYSLSIRAHQIMNSQGYNIGFLYSSNSSLPKTNIKTQIPIELLSRDAAVDSTSSSFSQMVHMDENISQPNTEFMAINPNNEDTCDERLLLNGGEYESVDKESISNPILNNSNNLNHSVHSPPVIPFTQSFESINSNVFCTEKQHASLSSPKVVTVFSSANYGGFSNEANFIIVSAQSLGDNHSNEFSNDLEFQICAIR
ncbi:hypothetical protein ADUPG1_000897 [Aduncisulcus paluster]|uniref:protein-serine/threonine phosphatase n=1 Tax=Aduncisulcus paluster TaxID=2918883 RepID=A0ABQ5K8G5_9EUKA|nr:hypothetical protein ADUPG1_000897 [Aduncisulcus paluster]